MRIIHTEFTGSYADVKGCPKYEMPEYAFVGRSNVGKSSLINYLTGRKDIARVSKKPGKTQLLNYFLVDKKWNLVDLPGYGYAKVSKTQLLKFKKMIDGYLLKRAQLACVFVLVDLSIAPQPIDMEFINWLGQMRIPFAMVYTKVDRIKKSALQKHINRFNKTLQENWEVLPLTFMTSTAKKLGKEALLQYIDSINVTLKENKA